MKQKLYVVHDRVANIYDTPVPSHNDGTIMRWFTQSIQNVPMMQTSPQDFALYYVGDVDTATGLIDARDTLLFVCTGLDCINNIQRGLEDEDQKVSDDTSVQSGSESGDSTL